MATRLYLVPDTPSEPKPNAKQTTTTISQWLTCTQGGGQDSASAIYPCPLSTTPGTSTYSSGGTVAETGATHYAWYKAFISPPLAAQTISGTLTFVADFVEGSVSANLMPRIYVYIWKADDTKGGDLYGPTNSTVEADTNANTLQTFFNAVTISSQSISDGDRIVIEVMSYDNNTKTSSYLHQLNFGGAVGSNTESYVEFSANLQWYTPIVSIKRTEGFSLADRLTKKPRARRSQGLTLSHAPAKSLRRKLGVQQFYPQYYSLIWACDMETARSGKARNAVGPSTYDGTITNLTLGGTTGKYGNATNWPDTTVARHITVDGTNTNSGPFCPSTGFTALAWIKPNLASGDMGTIVGKWYGATSGWAIALYHDGTYWTPYGMVSASWVYPPSGITPDSNWHLVALKYDPSAGKAYLQWDGGTSYETSASISWDTGYLRIGWDDIYDWRFKGAIDDVMYFNRCLSDAEVAQLYNSSKGLNLNDQTEDRHYFGPTFGYTVSASVPAVLRIIREQALAIVDAVTTIVPQVWRLLLEQGLNISHVVTRSGTWFRKYLQQLVLRDKAFLNGEVYHADMDTFNRLALKDLDESRARYIHEVAADAAQYWFDNFATVGDDVYVAFQGKDYATYVSKFDDSIGRWTTAKVADSPIAPDGHGAPGFAIDSNGYLHVMLGAHDSDVLYYKSVAPYTLEFALMPEEAWVSYYGTYPFLTRHPSTGKLYVFWRETSGTTYRWYYGIETTPEEYYWDYRMMLDSMNKNVYAVYPTDSCPRWKQVGSDWCLWFVATLWVVSESRRKDVYVWYLNTTDHHFYAVDGTDLGEYITFTQLDTYCKAYSHGSSPDAGSWGPVLTFRSDGNPIVATMRWNATDSTYEWISLYWTGSAWSTPVVIAPSVTDSQANVVGQLAGEGDYIAFICSDSTTNTSGGNVVVYDYDVATNSWSFNKILLRKEEAPSWQTYGGWGHYGIRTSQTGHVIISEGSPSGPSERLVVVARVDPQLRSAHIFGDRCALDGTVYNLSLGEGISGEALEWDGSSDQYVQVDRATDDIGAVTTTDALSVSLWVKHNSSSGGVYLLSKAVSNAGWSVESWYETPYIYFTVRDSSAWRTVLGESSLGEWHHIVGTVKKGGYLKLYIDTQLVDSISYSGDVTDSGGALIIGKSATANFDGMIDEVRIYKKELSQNEIDRLYLGRRLRSIREQGVALVDSLFKKPVKKLAEGVVATDRLLKRVRHVVVHALSLSAQPLKKLQRRITHGIALSDQPRKSLARRASQGLALADRAIKRAHRVVVHALNLADFVSTGRQIYRSLVHALSVSDSVRFSEVMRRSFAQGLAIAERLSRTLRRRASQALTLSDRLSKRMRRLLTDALTVSASVKFSEIIWRRFTQGLALADGATKRLTFRITHGLKVLDALSKTLRRHIAHGLSFVESLYYELISGGVVISAKLAEGLILSAAVIKRFRRKTVQGLRCLASPYKRILKVLKPTTPYNLWNRALWVSDGYGKVVLGIRVWTNRLLGPSDEEDEICYYLPVVRSYGPWPELEDPYYQGTVFNGVSDYGKIYHDPKYNTYTFTVSAWIYPEDSPPHGGILCKNYGDVEPSWMLGINSEGKPYFFVADFDRGPVWPTALSPNQWYLLTGVYDGSYIRLYVNGEPATPVAWSYPRNTSFDILVGIRKEYPTETDFFKGRISEVIIAGRAWSESEVKLYYETPLGLASRTYGANHYLWVQDRRLSKVTKRISQAVAMAFTPAKTLRFILRTGFALSATALKRFRARLTQSLAAATTLRFAIRARRYQSLAVSAETRKSTRKARLEGLKVTDIVSKAHQMIRRFIEGLVVTASTVKRFSKTTTQALAISLMALKKVRTVRQIALALDYSVRKQFRKLNVVGITMGTALRRTFRKVPVQALNVKDTLTRNVRRLIAHSLNVSERVTRRFIKSIAFGLGISEAIAFFRHRLVSVEQVLTVADTVRRHFTRHIEQALRILDTIGYAGRIMVRLVETELIAFAVRTISTTIRSYEQAIEIADVLRKTTHKKMAQTLAVADRLAKALRRQMVQGLALSASLLKRFAKRLSESIAVSLSLRRGIWKRLVIALPLGAQAIKRFRKPAYEGLKATDTVTKRARKSLGEGLTVVAGSLKRFTKDIRQGLALVAQFSHISWMRRYVIQGLSVTATATKRFIKRTTDGLNLVARRSMTTIKSMSEKAQVTLAMVKRLATRMREGLAVGDVLAKRLRKHLVSTLAVTASGLKQVTKVVRQTVTILVYPSFTGRLLKYITQGLSITASSAKHLTKRVTDSIKIADERFLALVKRLSEYPVIALTLFKSVIRHLLLVDSLRLAEAVRLFIGKIRLVESLAVRDVVRRVHHAYRKLTESLGILDSVLRHLVFTIKAVTTLGSYIRPSREASLSLMVLREETNQPVLGATVTGVIYRPDGTVYRSLTLTEVGTPPGLYKTTFRIYAADPLGVYPVTITAVAGENMAVYQGFLQIYQGPVTVIHFG